jgi:hypothetical protein
LKVGVTFREVANEVEECRKPVRVEAEEQCREVAVELPSLMSKMPVEDSVGVDVEGLFL